MKQYPAIYKSEDKSIYLYSDKNNYYCFARGFWDESEETDNHESDTNITHEYLSSTWGVVESKEHAEFIIELAEANGFDLIALSANNCNFFNFGGSNFAMLSNEPAFKGDCKQITIPLPPKAKEWPQVGDEVCWGIESSGVIKSLSDGFAWIKQGNNDYTTVYISSLKKPKSKQELLIEELQTKLCNNNAVDNYILACDIINGEIEGLSYGSADNAKLKLSAMINCRYTGLITPTDMGREIKKIADEAADFILSKYNLTPKVSK